MSTNPAITDASLIDPDTTIAAMTEPSQPPAAPSPVAALQAAMAARAAQWAAMGIDPAALRRTLGSVAAPPGTDAWAGHMSEVGEQAATAADALASASATPADRDRARRRYEEASFWFFLARFPAPSSPATWHAYHRSLDTALLAGELEATPLQVVRAPYGKGEVVGHLRLPDPDTSRPATRTRTALVVLTGGIDVFKADIEIRSLAEALHAAGAATLAVDMPGTGESPVPAAPGHEATYEALLAALAADPNLADRLDLDHVGVIGLSFGGHWATRLALTNPRIAAAVSISGPLHHTFSPANVAAAPPPTRAALAAALGATSSDPATVTPLVAALSVLDGTAGNLIASASPVPILALTGGRDELVPVQDTTLLTEHGYPADLLIYATDRHVASNHWTEHVPVLTDWIMHRLNDRAANQL